MSTYIHSITACNNKKLESPPEYPREYWLATLGNYTEKKNLHISTEKCLKASKKIQILECWSMDITQFFETIKEKSLWL